MRVIQKALTFDDVLLVPAHSRVLPREVSSIYETLSRKDWNVNEWLHAPLPGPGLASWDRICIISF